MLKKAIQQGRSERRGEGVRFWVKRERRMENEAFRRAGVGLVRRATFSASC